MEWSGEVVGPEVVGSEVAGARDGDGVGDSVGVRVVGSAVDGAEVLGSEVALVSSTAEFRWNV